MSAESSPLPLEMISEELVFQLLHALEAETGKTWEIQQVRGDDFITIRPRHGG